MAEVSTATTTHTTRYSLYDAWLSRVLADRELVDRVHVYNTRKPEHQALAVGDVMEWMHVHGVCVSAVCVTEAAPPPFRYLLTLKPRARLVDDLEPAYILHVYVLSRYRDPAPLRDLATKGLHTGYDACRDALRRA